MAEYLIQDTTLTAIADRIRELSGEDDTYTPEQMAGTGIGLVYDNAYDRGYSDGVATQPTPTIDVGTSGLITASAGDKSATLQLSSQQDRDLAAYNIRKGTNIFGVTGTLTSYEEYEPLIVQGSEIPRTDASEYSAGTPDYMYTVSDFNNKCFSLSFDEYIDATATESSGTITFSFSNYSRFEAVVYYRWGVEDDNGRSTRYTRSHLDANSDYSYDISAEGVVDSYFLTIDGVRFFE